MYVEINNKELKDRDLIYKRVSKCIDAILVTEGVLEYVTSIELIEQHKIIDSDYREYLINSDIKSYFYKEIKILAITEFRKLNLDKKSYIKKFIEKYDKLLN